MVYFESVNVDFAGTEADTELEGIQDRLATWLPGALQYCPPEEHCDYAWDLKNHLMSFGTSGFADVNCGIIGIFTGSFRDSHGTTVSFRGELELGHEDTMQPHTVYYSIELGVGI